MRAHGGSEAVLARAEAVVRQHGGTEAVLARAEAVVRAHGGSEAVLAREASHRNLQSHPTLRCLAPFARVGDVAAAQEDLLPRIGAGFTGLPGDLQRRLRLLYEATRAAEEAGGRTAEGGHTLVHQSFVARAWANLLESLDFLAQTHELNIRVNELGWYLGPLAAVAAGALGYFLFGRSGASAGLPAPSSPPAAPTGPRGPRPAGDRSLGDRGPGGGISGTALWGHRRRDCRDVEHQPLSFGFALGSARSLTGFLVDRFRPMSSRSCARFDFCRISKFLQRKFRKNRKISKWKKQKNFEMEKEGNFDISFFFWFTPWPDNRTGFCRFVSLSQCFLCCCSLLCNPVLVPGLLPLFFRKNCLLSPPLNKPFL